jgi:hypothetical protein
MFDPKLCIDMIFIILQKKKQKTKKKTCSSNEYGTQDKIEKEKKLEICTIVYIYLIYS